MSKSRQIRRKQQLDGVYIDKSKQNAGGFYEGMPGATTEIHAGKLYRKMITFVVSEDGQATSLLYAHPMQTTTAIADASNKEVQSMIVSAASKMVRKNKRKWFGAYYLFKSIRQERKIKRMSKAIEKMTEQIEQLTKTAVEQN